MRAHNTGRVVWFVGLSGAGKTTLSRALAASLESQGVRSILLDGDVIRAGLCADLGYSDRDRAENIRRTAQVAKIIADSGIMVLVATISPLKSHRAIPRAILSEIIEVFVDAPVEVCEHRDPKGLYRLAREGSLENFTGIASPFERPLEARVSYRTDLLDVDSITSDLLQILRSESILHAKEPLRRPVIC